MGKRKIAIAIFLGSDSDLPVMKEATETLDEFNIPYSIFILSAHRTAKALLDQLRRSFQDGVEVFIAAAGGAAHLPGVVAAQTTKPVIGVPIKTPTLAGVDSLYSIVQMPPGIPVATVGINAAKNAALLALEILTTHDNVLEKKLSTFRKNLAQGVLAKNEKLQKMGVGAYLESQKK